MACVIEQDVLWLEIAVDDFFAMDEAKGCNDLRREEACARQSKCALFAQQFKKLHAAQLHDEVQALRVLERAKEMHNMRVSASIERLLLHLYVLMLSLLQHQGFFHHFDGKPVARRAPRRLPAPPLSARDMAGDSDTDKVPYAGRAQQNAIHVMLARAAA